MKPNMIAALRQFATSLSDTEEGIACEGTTLEKRTIKVGKKAFAFFGLKDLMLKLADSLAEATAFADREPDQIKVGATGWVTVKFDVAKPIPTKTLEKWIGESYSLMTPKQAKKKRG